MQSRTPFSTDGMKLRGTAPPKMSSTNSKPPPRCIGSTRSHVSPYWPRPPVCFLYLPSLGASLHGLLVGNARRQQVHVDVVLPLHALDDHLHMQAADTRDQELLGLRVEVVVDRRVLFGDARQRVRDLVLVAARLGLDRERDRRLGERDLRQLERLRLLGERVARLRLLQL